MLFCPKLGRCVGKLRPITDEESAYIYDQVAKGNMYMHEYLTPDKFAQKVLAHSRPELYENIREQIEAVTEEERAQTKVDF